MKNFTKYAVCALAMFASMLMYALCFEPFGISELAYLFAIPLLFATRYFWNITPNYYSAEPERRLRKSRDKSFPESSAETFEGYSLISKEESLSPSKKWKFWLLCAFAFSYLAWGIILAWLRHVYPPAGYFAWALLPAVMAIVSIVPWLAVLPVLLPKINDGNFYRLSKLLGLAGAWVFLEWFRSWFCTGFPWLLLGESQWLRPAAIQIAEYGGVWSVSFVLIFCNLALGDYFYRLYCIQKARFLASSGRSERMEKIQRFAPEFYLALILLFLSAWIYLGNLPKKENEIYAFKAGMIQPEFEGLVKWEGGKALQNFRIVESLIFGMKSANVDVVLLPEAATPPHMPILGNDNVKRWFESVSRRNSFPILTGNMAYINCEEDGSEGYWQNGAFAISPKDGLGKEFYAKRKLVPFGEYTPQWAKFIGKIVPVGNLKSGEFDDVLNLKIADKEYKIGCMICYEDIFPSLGKNLSRKGADIFFVCTNDSWYGKEGGAWQHAAHSALQAVANRKVLLRASNNGLSAVFDQYGRMRPSITFKRENGMAWTGEGVIDNYMDTLDEHGNRIDPKTMRHAKSAPLQNESGSIYFRGAGYADVVFYKNFENKTSFYVKYGDWLIPLSLGFFLLALRLCWVKKRV